MVKKDVLALKAHICYYSSCRPLPRNLKTRLKLSWPRKKALEGICVCYLGDFSRQSRQSSSSQTSRNILDFCSSHGWSASCGSAELNRKSFYSHSISAGTLSTSVPSLSCASLSPSDTPSSHVLLLPEFPQQAFSASSHTPHPPLSSPATAPEQ